jgi:hypothetical protein
MKRLLGVIVLAPLMAWLIRLDEFWDASMVAADAGSWAESCQRQYPNPTQEGGTEARRALAISYAGLVATVRFDRTCLLTQDTPACACCAGATSVPRSV